MFDWPKGAAVPSRERRAPAWQRVSASRASVGRSHLAGLAVALTALVALPTGPGWHPPAAAQASDQVSLNVAPVTNATPASRVRLPIQVQARDGLVKNAFIRIRGLPATAALTEGYAIAPGAWAVPLNGLPSLMVIVPVGLEGKSEVVVALMNVEGSILAEATTTLSIARPAPPPVAAAPPPANSTTRALSAPQLAPADRTRAQNLHARGEEQLSRGNIYAARQFFERAAEVGLPESALALGATYDPAELQRLRVVGLKPELNEARKWYEKARELGAADAEARLRRLGGR